MHDLPHYYKVHAAADPEGDVSITGDKLAAISSAPPTEFGGPGDRWSPETLLVAAVADCFVLSFRAIARASKLSWLSVECEVDAKLERTDGKTKFTTFVIQATLIVPEDTNVDRARRILEKAEESCLVTNSLNASVRLDAEVRSVS